MDRFHPAALRVIPLLILLCFTLLATGCGVDFTAPKPVKSDPDILAGTWNGTLEDPAGTGNVSAMTINFNELGQITSIVSGGVDWNVNGIVEGVAGESRLFLIHLTDGAGNLIEAGFYTGGAFKHAGYMDENLNVAVVEKNGQLPPAGFVDSDLWGTTVARIINIDAGFNITGSSTSNVTVFTDNTIEGDDTSVGPFTGSLNIASATLGLATGTYVAAGAGISNGLLAAIISPDKSFVGSYTCSPTVAFGNCGFRVWSY